MAVSTVQSPATGENAIYTVRSSLLTAYHRPGIYRGAVRQLCACVGTRMSGTGDFNARISLSLWHMWDTSTGISLRYAPFPYISLAVFLVIFF
jgi:hypothetical protein